MSLPIVRLRIVRSSPHPWIFSKMVKGPDNPLPAGSLVEIRDRDGKFSGFGIYDPSHNVTLRVLSERHNDPVNEHFFHTLVERARSLRESILDIPRVSDSYRLIHGEADGLSGIIIDKLSDVLVVEPHTVYAPALLEQLAGALRTSHPTCRICLRGGEGSRSRSVKAKSAIATAQGFDPLPSSGEVREHGLAFAVDFASGHKTGFFLDQRENRLLIRELARDGVVYDVCSYTGGFSLNAAAGGAREVTGIDLDETAVAQARTNARRNGIEAAFIHRNAFEFLREKVAAKQAADVLVLDPAKLAQRREELPKALRTYHDLNHLAVQAVRPGGILATFSCTGLVSEEEFLATVSRAAHQARRTLQVFRLTGAAGDHPVAGMFPEGRYLKGVFARVF